MKIAICGSMSAAENIMEAKEELEHLGHEIIIPENMEKHLKRILNAHESTEEKIQSDLIRGYFEKIKNSDALLALNLDKNGVKNYVGGNTFLEIGFAHVLHKKIFLLNPIPEMHYKDEIIAMQPIVINGNFECIF